MAPANRFSRFWASVAAATMRVLADRSGNEGIDARVGMDVARRPRPAGTLVGKCGEHRRLSGPEASRWRCAGTINTFVSVR